MLRNNICVFKFQTTSPRVSDCEILRVSALVINPRNLTAYDGAEFASTMRASEPQEISEGALAKHRITREEVAAAPHPEEVWHRFADWVSGFNLKGRSDSRGAPVPVGYDLLNVDWPIYDRYCRRYGPTRKGKSGEEESSILHNVWKFDVLQLLAMWTENLPEPEKLSLDAIRKYFAIPRGEGPAHDVRDIAAIYGKLMNLTRGVAPRVVWKDCFDPVKVEAELGKRKQEREARAARSAERDQARLRREGAGGSWKDREKS